MCDGVTQGEAGMELSLFWRGVIALSTAAPMAACPAARPSAIRATPEAAAGGAIGKICAEVRLDASAGGDFRVRLTLRRRENIETSFTYRGRYWTRLRVKEAF